MLSDRSSGFQLFRSIVSLDATGISRSSCSLDDITSWLRGNPLPCVVLVAPGALGSLLLFWTPRVTLLRRTLWSRRRLRSPLPRESYGASRGGLSGRRSIRFLDDLQYKEGLHRVGWGLYLNSSDTEYLLSRKVNQMHISALTPGILGFRVNKQDSLGHG